MSQPSRALIHLNYMFKSSSGFLQNDIMRLLLQLLIRSVNMFVPAVIDSHPVVVRGTAGGVFEPCQVVRCVGRKWMKHESSCVDFESAVINR